MLKVHDRGLLPATGGARVPIGSCMVWGSRAAERFRLAVGAAVDRIATAAESLPILEGAYRRVRVKRFPYVLIFRRKVSGDYFIVAVAHTSRRPGYWRGRG